MRILELRFQNLNSLYGEWLLDFTHPEYVSNGIFALTGSTGAGKSTVLDAICLALYGTTPRLGKITTSGNDIMSRQTGECFAEVLFESQTGRFRCHWGHHRAGKKADGALQESTHEISDDRTGKLIETKKSLVSGIVEEKTGMDFDRFNRSILLAQGHFDNFLKANAEEKSSILEDITGTEIYSKISCKVHERKREEEEKLKSLQDEIAGIEILSSAEKKEIKGRLEINQKEEKKQNDQITCISKAINWLNEIRSLNEELESLDRKSKQLESERDKFQPEQTRLDLAEKAAHLDGDFATLSSVRKQQSTDKLDLKDEQERQSEAESSTKQTETTLENAKKQIQENKEARRKEAPQIEEVKKLDWAYNKRQEDIDSQDMACQKDEREIETKKANIALKEKEQNTAQNELNSVEEYLEEHASDEWLVSGLTGVEEQLGQLISEKEDIKIEETKKQQIEASLSTAVEQLKRSTEEREKQEQNLHADRKELENCTKELENLLNGRPLREHRSQRDTLFHEISRHKKITELESERKNLQDGTPCPLCGSSEHPYAAGNTPMPSVTEQEIEALKALIDEAEGKEADIQERKNAENKTLQSLKDCKNNESNAATEKKREEANRDTAEKNLTEKYQNFKKLKKTILDKLQPLGIDSDLDVPLLQSLNERLKTWLDKKQNKTDLEKQLSALVADVKSKTDVMKELRRALSEKRATLKINQEKNRENRNKRKELFGEKDTTEELTRLNEAINAAEKAASAAQQKNEAARKKQDKAEAKIDSLQKRIKNRHEEQERLEREFEVSRQSFGFTSEEAFCAARLERSERDRISKKAGELDSCKTRLQTRLADGARRLTAKKEQNLLQPLNRTESSAEDLSSEKVRLESALENLRHAMAEERIRLEKDAKARERAAKKQDAVEGQEKECRNWDKLHALIGSADGKKYRNFAQGLTFGLMVSHANQQLQKMTDRYILVRDKKQTLDLNVMDCYLAGEIRPTRNLSGGESFIASLSLALGLSKMASHNVRVDSLFLDEGFGTLDEEALETALVTLSGLQQDGKLIGVISHVPALKERIQTQIRVVSQGGGKSVLTGAGVQPL